MAFHKTNKNWKKINSFLLKNETMSDCAFLVEEGKIVTKIPAHKYILGGYSPEFYSLFYLMEADSDEIPIKDVSVESLTKFLEFVYTETTEISLDTFDDLLLLARRYSVESFQDFCEDFLIKTLTEDNVLVLMEKYSIYNLSNFDRECIQNIRRNDFIFQDPTFYEISNRTLETILKSDQLFGFKEITIFKGVEKWSEKYCQRNNQIINSENKRSALGPALQYIRFGAMTNKEFSSTCSLNPILNPMEIIAIFQNIASNGQTVCSYSSKRRTGKMKIFDLLDLGDIFGLPNSSIILNKELFSFTVHKTMKFYGFGISGRVNDLDSRNPVNFTIKLEDENKMIVRQNFVAIQPIGTSNQVYKLRFRTSTTLKAGKEYKVYIKRQTPGEFHNFEGSKSVGPINVEDICTITRCHSSLAAIMYED